MIKILVAYAHMPIDLRFYKFILCFRLSHACLHLHPIHLSEARLDQRTEPTGVVLLIWLGCCCWIWSGVE